MSYVFSLVLSNFLALICFLLVVFNSIHTKRDSNKQKRLNRRISPSDNTGSLRQPGRRGSPSAISNVLLLILKHLVFSPSQKPPKTVDKQSKACTCPTMSASDRVYAFKALAFAAAKHYNRTYSYSHTGSN